MAAALALHGQVGQRERQAGLCDPGGRAARLGLPGHPRNGVPMTADKKANVAASGDLPLELRRDHDGVTAAKDLGFAGDGH